MEFSNITDELKGRQKPAEPKIVKVPKPEIKKPAASAGTKKSGAVVIAQAPVQKAIVPEKKKTDNTEAQGSVRKPVTEKSITGSGSAKATPPVSAKAGSGNAQNSVQNQPARKPSVKTPVKVTSSLNKVASSPARKDNMEPVKKSLQANKPQQVNSGHVNSAKKPMAQPRATQSNVKSAAVHTVSHQESPKTQPVAQKSGGNTEIRRVVSNGASNVSSRRDTPANTTDKVPVIQPVKSTTSAGSSSSKTRVVPEKTDSEPVADEPVVSVQHAEETDISQKPDTKESKVPVAQEERPILDFFGDFDDDENISESVPDVLPSEDAPNEPIPVVNEQKEASSNAPVRKVVVKKKKIIKKKTAIAANVKETNEEEMKQGAFAKSRSDTLEHPDMSFDFNSDGFYDDTKSSEAPKADRMSPQTKRKIAMFVFLFIFAVLFIIFYFQPSRMSFLGGA